MPTLPPGLAELLDAEDASYAAARAVIAEHSVDIERREAELRRRVVELHSQHAEARAAMPWPLGRGSLDEDEHIGTDAPTLIVNADALASGVYIRDDELLRGNPVWRLVGTAWRLYWSHLPGSIGWCIGEDHAPAPRYRCELDERLGQRLGRWASREEMEGWCAEAGNSTELFRTRWVPPLTLHAAEDQADG